LIESSCTGLVACIHVLNAAPRQRRGWPEQFGHDDDGFLS
jgi:hypothetical protein